MAGEQTAANILVAMKRETTPGEAPSASGATRIRLVDGSAGLHLGTALAESAEKRSDGNKQKGRHSGKSVDGGYNLELTEGGAIDIAIEAVIRSTWGSPIAKDEADFTSLAIASNVITAGSGSFITEGFRVGQVVYMQGLSEAANNDVNCLVTALTASTMTVAPAKGVALTDMSADTSFDIFARGDIHNATTPTRYHHSVEQYDQDIDQSELFLGVKIVGLTLNIVPNQPITVELRMMGLDREAKATGDSPYFSSPTLTTGLALVADDVTLRYNGNVVTSFTSLTLNFDLVAAGQPVIGTRLSPDVFDNDLVVSGQASIIRSDHAQITLYDEETEFEIGILMEDRHSSTSPFPCVGLFLPVVTIDDLNAPAGGGDGPKVETLTLGFGTKPAAVSGYEPTIVQWSSSAQA